MSRPPQRLDPLLASTNRLAMMAVLHDVDQVEFVTLRDRLGVSDSVLSKLIGGLAEPGYVTVRKGVLGGRRTTWVAATRRGHRALTGHVAALRALIAHVGTAEPERSLSRQ